MFQSRIQLLVMYYYQYIRDYSSLSIISLKYNYILLRKDLTVCQE